MKKPRVFISYAHKDKDIVVALTDKLRPNAVVWIDGEMGPGDHISDTVRHEINACDRIVLCASRNSLQSTWVQDELHLTLSREKQERTSLLIVVVLDAFLGERWNSPIASYLNDRLIVDFRGIPTGSSAFTGNTKRLRDALSREAQYSPLIDGTWGYVVHNLSKERLLVGAFRLEAKHGSLLIPKGLTFKVTKRGKRSPWLDWKSELVAYDGTQLGCFYEGTLLARKLEYARNVRAAWLLREGADLLTFAGERFR